MISYVLVQVFVAIVLVIFALLCFVVICVYNSVGLSHESIGGFFNYLILVLMVLVVIAFRCECFWYFTVGFGLCLIIG